MPDSAGSTPVAGTRLDRWRVRRGGTDRLIVDSVVDAAAGGRDDVSAPARSSGRDLVVTPA